MKQTGRKTILALFVTVMLLGTTTTFSYALQHDGVPDALTCNDKLLLGDDETTQSDGINEPVNKHQSSLDSKANDEDDGLYIESDSNNEYRIGDYTYVLADTYATITRYTGTDLDLTIPSELDGHTVIDIDSCAFRDCGSLRSVTIPQSVRSIGSDAFAGCDELRAVALPEGLETIGCNVFTSPHIAEITIPSTLTRASSGYTYGHAAFSGCTGLRRVTFAPGTTRIPDAILYCAWSVAEISLPEGVTEIGDRAFRETAIASVSLPSTLKRIRGNSFWSCNSLDSIEIPDGVEYIDGEAFRDCGSLRSVTIPQSVRSIGSDAFAGCSNLTIQSYEGTCAQKYAEEQSIPFVSLGRARDEHYPTGYAFKRDSYSFENFEAYIPYGYWATVYESGAGKLCWKNWRAGGLCFGMTLTTASILASQPKVTSFVYRGSSSDGVRDLVLSSTLHGTTGLGNVGSVAHLNSNSDIPIDSFIKYAHIFQYSTEATDAVNYVWLPERNVRDASRLLDAVKDSVNSGSPYVTIKMVGPLGGHRVLAIGYDGNDILIDDPNNTERPERLTINDDGTWEFSGYGGFRSDAAGAKLGYTASRDLVTRPWRVLAGGNAALTGAGWAVGDGEALIGGLAPLDSENTLVRVDAENYRVTGGDIVELGEGSGGSTLDGGVDTEGMCWVLGTNEVTVSDVRGGNGTVEVGSDDALITADVPDGATVTASVDESDASTTVEGADSKSVSISVDHINKDGSDVTTTISGVAQGEVDVTREGDMVMVSGASDVTVSLETPEGTSDIHADAPDGGDLVFGIGADGAIESLIPISEAVVKPVPDKPYTGKAITPDISVTFEGRTLKRGADYEVSYSNNVNVGNATITITGIGSYAGTKTTSFRITKIGNTMIASSKKAKVSTTYSARKARKTAANVNVSKAQGTVTYVNASTNAQARRFTVNRKTGKVTLAKGTKVGTYPVKIKVAAAGDANHKAMTKTVSFKVAVGKAPQPMKVAAVKRSVKHSSVKKKNVIAARPIRFTAKAQGTLAYKKVSGAKCLSVNAKTGKVTVKKGTRKDTYKVKIKVTAKGTKNYKAGSKSLTCVVVVK